MLLENKGEFDFCVAYEYLKHSKMLQNSQNNDDLSLSFDRKRILRKNKRAVGIINKIHKRLEKFDDTGINTISGELLLSKKTVSTFQRQMSINTDFSSNIELCSSEKELRKGVGFVIKGSLNEVFKKVFHQ
mmetsp:Transcript_520/g.581  ORF Transcript_520/g.581 Transcript_520/m.581 type:complete len:131 (+) Transcript_520:689-1081(+)